MLQMFSRNRKEREPKQNKPEQKLMIENWTQKSEFLVFSKIYEPIYNL